jgi:hypothetical protein
MRNPTTERPLWSIWDMIPASSRQQALKVLQSFTKDGTNG